MQKPECVACHSKKIKQLNFLSKYSKYVLMKCSQCGLKFILSQNFETLDDDSYWDDVNKKIYAMPIVLNEFKKKQDKYLKKIIKLSPPNKKLLDVGSGSGIFIENARLNGLDATGIEPSSIAVELCKKIYDFSLVQGYLTVDSNLPKNFGILSAWDVIEHVFNPKEFLKICHAHLEHGGILLLETPDESSLIRKLINIFDFTKKIFKFGSSSNIYYPSHRYYFTHKSIKILLNEVGFSNVSIYKERSIYSKSIAKYKLYRQYSNIQMVKYHILFFILKAPLFWNKQVILCRKKM